MKSALHWLGVLLDATHLVLAVTLALIPEARNPGTAQALSFLLAVNGARMLWAGYRAGAFGMTPADMARAPQRPRVSMILALAMMFSAWALTASAL